MTSTKLKKLYPKLWNEIYESSIVDLLQHMSQADVQQYKQKNKHCRILVIAHNAAFNACYAVHKRNGDNK